MNWGILGPKKDAPMQRIELDHQVTYNTETHVEVSVVARALLASEALIKESVSLLDNLFPEASFSISDMRVENLSNNSPLKEILTVGVFMAFQDDLERQVPHLVEGLLGAQVSSDHKTLVTVGVIITAICVIDQIVQRLFPGKDIKELKGTYERQLKEASKLTGKSIEDIDAYLRANIGGKLKGRLAKAALEFFLPAKQDGGVAIIGSGGQLVSEAAIREIPHDVDFAELDKRRFYELDDVSVDIHRSDIDSNSQGWRGAIDEVSEKILKIELFPEISPRDLYGKTGVTADVLIIEEQDAEGEWSPKVIHIKNFRN